FGVEEEPARADRQYGRFVAHHDQTAPFGLKYPIKTLAKWPPRGHHGQRFAEGRTPACAHCRIVPGSLTMVPVVLTAGPRTAAGTRTGARRRTGSRPGAARFRRGPAGP